MREKCEVLIRLKCAILVHTFFCPRPKMSNLDFGVLRRRCSLPNFDGVLNANLQIGHFIMRTEKLVVVISYRRINNYYLGRKKTYKTILG